VTGSILSWGTGWNTIIFSEYLQSSEPGVPSVWVPGIGSLLDLSNFYGNTVVLVFLLVIICVIVLSMEGLIWRRLIRRFEKYKVEVG
jgi:ABC-type anion transport system duplicated permease subunit